MEHKDYWRVRCDMTRESPKYDVFRDTQWDKRKRRFMDIEFAPGQPIEGFYDEMDAWKLARTLKEDSF
jgi:hypothetical protein